jgi:hypothetical protein
MGSHPASTLHSVAARGRPILLSLAVLSAFRPQPTPAATIHVPGDAASIWKGVDMAEAGDSVLVGPGVWTDRDRRLVQFGQVWDWVYSAAFLKPGITVIGVEGAKSTTVDGGSETDTWVVTFLHIGASSVPARIEGFTITGGGTGAHVHGQSPLEIVECRIVENGRYGVLATHSNVSLFDCEVLENYLTSEGGPAEAGIWAEWSALEMRGCRLARNRMTGLVFQYGQPAVIDGCEFVDQPWRGGGGIVHCPDVQVSNSLFLRCSVSSLGGGLRLASSDGRVEFCVFAYDSATTGRGGGVALSACNVQFHNNTFYRCHCPSQVAGSAIQISETDAGFAGNVAAFCTGGPALRMIGGPISPLTGCNLLWLNEGGDYADNWVPADTDIYADPMFCDAEGGDYTVHVSSPAAEENSPVCGQIGAFGIGCGSVSVESVTWGRLKNRKTSPYPVWAARVT